jgi:hypothetical protein
MTTTPVDPIVELQVDGDWMDITSDCRQGSADSGGGFEITRGIPNEGNVAEPTQFNFTLNNGVSKAMPGYSGVYSPSNPMGPWFGLLGRNQRVRVGYDRRHDNVWAGTIAGGWGKLPNRLHADGTTTVVGEPWHYWGDQDLFSVGSSKGTITADSTFKAALLTRQYRDHDTKMRFRLAGALTSEVGIITRMSQFSLPFPSGLAKNGPTGWGSTAGTLTADATTFRGNNTTSLKMAVTSVAPATATIFANISAATMVPAPNSTNSNTYTVGAWIRADHSANCRVGVSWYAEDGSTFLASTTTDFTPAANTWTWFQISSSPPQDAYYARIFSGYSTGSGVTSGWQFWMSDPEVQDPVAAEYYAVTLLLATNQVRIYRSAGGTVRELGLFTFPPTLAVATDYWMRVQMTGMRLRFKIWADADPEPVPWTLRTYDNYVMREPQVDRTGEVGVVSNGGATTLTVDRFQVDQWRAHTEISKLPARFDISRQDFWVPVQSRGILRRLNQGRKALQSPVTLHLNAYTPLSFGWLPLEKDEGQSAGNAIQGGQAGAITGITISDLDSSGAAALPGVQGAAAFEADTSTLSLGIPNHTSSGKETILWFARIPALPGSDSTIATLYSTGTIRTWQWKVSTSGAFTITGIDRFGAVLTTATVAGWNGNADLPTGSWIAFTLYLLQNGGNVDWALNHHRPGSSSFFTCTGSVAGTVGVYTGLKMNSNAALVSAGNLQITQIMHYADDLPFVTTEFARAARAYDQEKAGTRALRLGSNAGVPIIQTGASTVTATMGPQTPSKLTELLEETAEADGGFLMEERDDFGLTIVARNSIWNRLPRILHIDQGHLTAPLDPDTDDQQTRNDVTVSRPGGSFRRAIKETGPLNVNLPEDDPEGVGVYDEQVSVNVGNDDLCTSHANYRMGRGTLEAPRYPSFTCNMAASVFQASQALAADVMGLDLADRVLLYNTETDYIPRNQGIQSYTESVDDIYSWELVYTALPNDTRLAGVVNTDTRVGSESMVTAASFTAGTDTALSVTSSNGMAFVRPDVASPDIHWPFDIDVAGVRLRVVQTSPILNANSDFETSPTEWANTSANVSNARDRFSPRSGTYCLRMHAAAAGTDGIVQAAANSTTTTPGASYLVSGWIKVETATADARIAIDWYQADNTTFISTTLPTAVALSANVWTWYSAVVVAPALAARGRIKTRFVYTASYRAWVDKLRLQLTTDYTSATQKLQVEQVPVNAEFGVTGKVIPSGSKIRITDAFRVGWGDSL